MSMRVLRHFASSRAPEVLALQASPILGSVLGGLRSEWDDVLRLGLLLFASFALTAHIFLLNDWAGHSTDIHDLRRATTVFTRQGISQYQMAQVAIVLLLVAGFALAVIGSTAFLIGSAIAALGFLYSCSATFGKRTPVVGSFNHLLGGALHFLLGYTLHQAVDSRGLVISLFFGLVFAGGHLNQEVRDYEADRFNGLRTSAVVFGCRRTFLASLGTFSAAYAIVAALAVLGVLPRLLLLSLLLWPIHAAWSLGALQRGLGFEAALWMQRRYRLLFACIGLALAAG